MICRRGLRGDRQRQPRSRQAGPGALLLRHARTFASPHPPFYPMMPAGSLPSGSGRDTGCAAIVVPESEPPAQAGHPVGLRGFDANLIIAIVQDDARNYPSNIPVPSSCDQSARWPFIRPCVAGVRGATGSGGRPREHRSGGPGLHPACGLGRRAFNSLFRNAGPIQTRGWSCLPPRASSCVRRDGPWRDPARRPIVHGRVDLFDPATGAFDLSSICSVFIFASCVDRRSCGRVFGLFSGALDRCFSARSRGPFFGLGPVSFSPALHVFLVPL